MSSPSASTSTSPRRVRITIAILVLCVVPIAVAVVVGVVRKGDGTNRPATATERAEEVADSGGRGDALLAFTAVGLVVAGCVATPFVLARRKRGAAGAAREPQVT